MKRVAVRGLVLEDDLVVLLGTAVTDALADPMLWRCAATEGISRCSGSGGGARVPPPWRDFSIPTPPQVPPVVALRSTRFARSPRFARCQEVAGRQRHGYAGMVKPRRSRSMGCTDVQQREQRRRGRVGSKRSGRSGRGERARERGMSAFDA